VRRSGTHASPFTPRHLRACVGGVARVGYVASMLQFTSRHGSSRRGPEAENHGTQAHFGGLAARRRRSFTSFKTPEPARPAEAASQPAGRACQTSRSTIARRPSYRAGNRARARSRHWDSEVDPSGPSRLRPSLRDQVLVAIRRRPRARRRGRRCPSGLCCRAPCGGGIQVDRK
jgi:hypothetical protein